MLLFCFFSGRSDQFWEEEKGMFTFPGLKLLIFKMLKRQHWILLVFLQEFEVIAQIKLLQLASNNYSFTQESHFREWFAAVEKLSEAERYHDKQIILILFCRFTFLSY